MSKYEAPKVNIVEFESTDIIQTSSLTLGGPITVPAVGTVVPTPKK